MPRRWDGPEPMAAHFMVRLTWSERVTLQEVASELGVNQSNLFRRLLAEAASGMTRHGQVALPPEFNLFTRIAGDIEAERQALADVIAAHRQTPSPQGQSAQRMT